MKDQLHDFDFDEAISVEPVFEPSDRFLEAFYRFAGRLQSLQRYFHFSSRYIAHYLAGSELSRILTDLHAEYAERGIVHDDVTLTDRDYFIVFLSGSVITNVFALLESLVAEVAQDVAGVLGHPVELHPKPMPYINRYVNFLVREGGLPLRIDSATWKSLDHVRALRNKYVHEFVRDIPAGIGADQTSEGDTEIFEELILAPSSVECAFSVAGQFAKQLESAYWIFYETHSPAGRAP